jgi:hypothetical protein
MAWGGAGIMTLAVMTRTSLGHTGQELRASGATQAIYLAIITAALARICAVLHPAASEVLSISQALPGWRPSSASRSPIGRYCSAAEGGGAKAPALRPADRRSTSHHSYSSDPAAFRHFQFSQIQGR